MSLDSYKDDVTCDIKDCLRNMGCQPVIFLGSGVSRRYYNAPSWEELLAHLCRENPLVDRDFLYFKQSSPDLPSVASRLVRPYHEWAWSKGRRKFDPELFNSDLPMDIFLKSFVADHFTDLLNSASKSLSAKLTASEISGLQKIRPNSVITTNYDQLVETIFPDYVPIVGQQIIKSPAHSIGEIFKIHGCVSSPMDLVLTAEDYAHWIDRKKYLSAKLLICFLEHPVLIVGYSAQDPNVLAILKDIDEILASSGEIVPNIYYVIYNPALTDAASPSKEMLLDLGDGRSMRVKAIYTNALQWVYDAFSASEGLENVNPKLLRALLSRTFQLVRHDIPKKTLEVDYRTLEQAVTDESSLPKLLGITAVSDPDQFNAAYPHTLSGVAERMGYNYWHHANVLLKQIKEVNGVDIKSSDNQYHIRVKSGVRSFFHKYSDSLIELLKKVRDGKAYSVNLRVKRTHQ